MTFDTDPLAATHPGSDEAVAVAASLAAAKEGIDGAGQIFTTGSPFMIDETDFGDSVDYWLAWNAAGSASVTLGTGVAFGKTVMVSQLGAGVATVANTNIVNAAGAATAQYASLVYRSLGDDTWLKVAGP